MKVKPFNYVFFHIILGITSASNQVYPRLSDEEVQELMKLANNFTNPLSETLSTSPTRRIQKSKNILEKSGKKQSSEKENVQGSEFEIPVRRLNIESNKTLKKPLGESKIIENIIPVIKQDTQSEKDSDENNQANETKNKFSKENTEATEKEGLEEETEGVKEFISKWKITETKIVKEVTCYEKFEKVENREIRSEEDDSKVQVKDKTFEKSTVEIKEKCVNKGEEKLLEEYPRETGTLGKKSDLLHESEKTKKDTEKIDEDDKVVEGIGGS